MMAFLIVAIAVLGITTFLNVLGIAMGPDDERVLFIANVVTSAIAIVALSCALGNL